MRLLIHESSYRRIQESLDALADRVEPLVMDDAGAISLHGRAVADEPLGIDIGWANSDVFQSPAARAFSVALLKAPALKWVQSGAAGTDHPVFGQFLAKGARLTTSHGQAVGIAEYVISGALDALQRGPERRAAQAAGRWERLLFREVGRSRWLVVGFGAIGQGVAARARALGAHVTGVRRSPGAHPDADRMSRLEDLPHLVSGADVVVLCCPLTAETRHLVNGDLLARMADGAILVNVGRGALVDEAALLEALDRGRVGHAVLDVFETEPLPPENPLWHHPRVSLTAHAAGDTLGARPRNDRAFLDNLHRFLAGEPLEHEVTRIEAA